MPLQTRIIQRPMISYPPPMALYHPRTFQPVVQPFLHLPPHHPIVIRPLLSFQRPQFYPEPMATFNPPDVIPSHVCRIYFGRKVFTTSFNNGSTLTILLNKPMVDHILQHSHASDTLELTFENFNDTLTSAKRDLLIKFIKHVANLTIQGRTDVTTANVVVEHTHPSSFNAIRIKFSKPYGLRCLLLRLPRTIQTLV